MNPEKCPNCGELTIEVIPTTGSKLLGDTKKCRNCNFSVIPKLPSTLGELNKKIKKNKKNKQ